MRLHNYIMMKYITVREYNCLKLTILSSVQRQRQRQRVTEGTAMAPWNGPNNCGMLQAIIVHETTVERCVRWVYRSAQGAVPAGDAPLGELHVRNVRRAKAGRLQLHPLHRTTVRVRCTQSHRHTHTHTQVLFQSPCSLRHPRQNDDAASAITRYTGVARSFHCTHWAAVSAIRLAVPPKCITRLLCALFLHLEINLID